MLGFCFNPVGMSRHQLSGNFSCLLITRFLRLTLVQSLI